ncbi:hypothetical protein EJ05DRAFT_383690 [Pseudovirgaria hyperparasitica]|uniref:Transcription factor Nrm1/Whi5 n=1 Tax=Pseudovirgaria hyperparasitica TaxID=470096 RepID=A0A6A6W6P4_9PEZI|nr:uncharacterized protein EJ05DRAFT_383690 [Pseudovirgaria hyperparasitica]KAF2758293.1 hypothetical protein EJ05DRAFT_383690 [Pseudovirgaria hyperparasitica]
MATAIVERMEQPAEVASKVLRRAQVSKMTRALQSRLALANVKTKHGWENLSIDTIEPKIDMELKRKRPGSSNDAFSDTSSIVSGSRPASRLDSSPLAAPLFSDQNERTVRSFRVSKRRQIQQAKYPGSSNHTRVKTRHPTTTVQSWKSLHRLPESSPVYNRRHTYFPSSRHGPSLSFVPEFSTAPHEPTSPVMSEDDDEDLPLHSFQIASNIQSSPPPRSPRTPPRALAGPGIGRNDPFSPSRNTPKGEEDANLLVYLATSPSQNQSERRNRVTMAPSTPPPRITPLPSSMMSTPGAGGGGGGGSNLSGFGFMTPGANINFADFINVTPSPGQLGRTWARTPKIDKTPNTTREARRCLNYDGIMPPSPSVERNTSGITEGLSMDLGGRLPVN